jgi:hypothetical protein
MLEITITEPEQYDEINERFIPSKSHVLKLEHSLVSLTKWESKWRKPFLSKQDKTYEETMDYIRCMTITQNVNPIIYNYIDKDGFDKINKYIADPMTATTFPEEKNKSNKEIVTAELIYYWMIAMNIPIDFQKWHLNKLLTLIKVCSIKNAPSKKMSKKDVMDRHTSLNQARRNKLKSKG